MLVFGCLCVQGQTRSYNTTMQIKGSLFYFNKMNALFSTQVGIDFSRAVYNDFSVGVTYSLWPYSEYLFSSLNDNNTPFVGQFFAREKYQFIDAYGKYTLDFSRNRLYGRLGLSYANGYRWDIIDVYQVYGYEVRTTVGRQRDNKVGGVASIGYDFLFFKRRINLGISTTARYYGNSYQQYELSLNIGYNFNAFSNSK